MVANVNRTQEQLKYPKFNRLFVDGTTEFKSYQSISFEYIEIDAFQQLLIG